MTSFRIEKPEPRYYGLTLENDAWYENGIVLGAGTWKTFTVQELTEVIAHEELHGILEHVEGLQASWDLDALRGF